MVEPNKVIIPYTPRPLQQTFHEQCKRFNVAVCHRRFGKTVMAINWLLREILTCERKNAQGAYIAPTYAAAKRIAWVMLREYAGVIPGGRFNEAELRYDGPDGKRIWLLGGENVDALRGLRLDSAVMDEYADMNARLFPEIIRPALSDFGTGKALWIGTPRGTDQFKAIYDTALGNMEKGDDEWFAMRFPASETNIIPEKELQAARDTMDESQYEQEFECSWAAALVGAYYAKALDRIELQGQVGSVPWEPNAPVWTAWDLGMRDSTAIWFGQSIRGEVGHRIIDYYESSGEGLHHYISHLRAQPYVYGDHYFPHDVLVRELGSGSSRYEMLQGHAVRPTIVSKLSLQDGIEAVRALIPTLHFDRDNCSQGLKYLRHYHRQWNDRNQTWREKPNHDASSHSADAMRYAAIGLRHGNDNDYAMMAQTGRGPGGQPVIISDYNEFG
tara:strand:+ start:2683 stop:4014 length:1332 start_codon:yes stop_codon:yes gene_type:complete